MCGIAGYVAFDGPMPPPETIERMLATLRHRGPDGFGIHYGERCVLGHARLSIIDLEGGWQPIFNENRDVAVTFNGEIYNYIELRKELEGDGHRFYTNSDTEVVVHAYEEWGTACPERFNGQFGFAIHDNRDGTLFLCRDRLGVRPVYHARAGNVFLFASEVKALRASGLVHLEPSLDGLHQIFTLWTNVYPATPFRNVFEVPPAHGMVVSPRGTCTKRYWSLPLGRKEVLSPGECVEGLKAHLERSVRLRLRADVPVGAYLSGGLDSSLTAAFTRRCTSTPLKSFSLEFEDPRFDESEYQGEMARLLGTEHSSIRVGAEEIAAHFPEAIRAAERPILRTAPVPMLLLSRLVRSEGYKVVITGEGADEFLLGYDIFKETKVREYCSRRPGSRLRPLLLRRLYPYLFPDRRTASFQEAFFLKGFTETTDPFYGHRLRFNHARRIRDFYSRDAANRIREDPESVLLRAMPRGFSELSPIERTQVVEIETLLSAYLLSSQGDRVAMANSVEGRFVFLDHELIEFVSRIEPNRKMTGLREKAILKEIGRGILPTRIIERKKFPYRAPDIESFLNTAAGRQILDEALEPSGLERIGLFDPRKVQELAAKVVAGAKTNGRVTTSDNLVLMGVLSGQIFHKQFFGPSVPAEGFHPHDRVRRIVQGTVKGEDEWLRATQEG
ncbi:MAG: asparagine synthase (glutamine-hydrolyzing) [Deltaproteobacteria bacterium]|nr:MAG: asparagine synthase (glutamine-hydrolyzing) [Deltaproteobacteria bacterium]